MGVDRATFYDMDRVAVVPMAFCFPGYDAKGSDLPPPPVCAATWRDRVMDTLPDVRLKLIVGAYAMHWHLGVRGRMTDIVRDFPQYPANLIPLPHPSWRNTGWLQKNPWFETDLLPVLRRRVKEALSD